MVKTNGYAALLTVITIGVILSAVMYGILLRDKYSLSMMNAVEKKYLVNNLVESCAEEAFLRYQREGSFLDEVILPIGSCTISNFSSSGFNVSGELDSVKSEIRVEIGIRTGNTTIINWKQME